jgi:putative endonuclease
MYFIYIIYSEKSDKYYIGHSENPERRLIEHNTDPRTTYTSKHRPWILKASVPVTNYKGDAVKIERKLKRLKSRKLIEKIIENPNDKGIIHQFCGIKNPIK